jgi:hypothetical protein
MRRNAALDAVTRELAAAGIDFQIEHGGKQPLANGDVSWALD